MMSRPSPALLSLLAACQDPETKGDTGPAETSDRITAATILVLGADGVAVPEATAETSLWCEPTVEGTLDGITYIWTLNGQDSPVTSQEIDGVNFSKGDVIACTATASDGSSSATAATVSIYNAAPQITSVTIDPDTLTAGATDASCAVEVEDADGADDLGDVEIYWTIDGDDGAEGLDSSGEPTAGGIYTGQELACWASVTDAEGETASDSASVVVGDPLVRDGSSAPAAALSCDDLVKALGDPVNADYWVHPDGTTDSAAEATTCIFDLHEEVFTYAGFEEEFTVPSGVGYVTVQAWGAGGGGSYQGTDIGGGYSGGGGGYSVGTVPVSAGDTLQVVVGAGGTLGGESGSGNWSEPLSSMGGGGHGGPVRGGGSYAGAAAGGGYSGVFDGAVSFTSPLVIAGGGGGGGRNFEAGAGGGTEGGDGGGGANFGGRGGTISGGGDGAGSGSYCHTNGTSTDGSGDPLYGGSGCDFGTGDGGAGGGGGGYYGGGGGGMSASDQGGGGGGGGAAFVHADALNPVRTAGSGASAAGTSEPGYPGSVGGGGGTRADGQHGAVIIRY